MWKCGCGCRAVQLSSSLPAVSWGAAERVAVWMEFSEGQSSLQPTTMAVFRVPPEPWEHLSCKGGMGVCPS